MLLRLGGLTYIWYDVSTRGALRLQNCLQASVMMSTGHLMGLAGQRARQGGAVVTEGGRSLGRRGGGDAAYTHKHCLFICCTGLCLCMSFKCTRSTTYISVT